jgi:hypothetical protein
MKAGISALRENEPIANHSGPMASQAIHLITLPAVLG